MTATQPDTLAKEKVLPNLKDIQMRMKDGEEPTEVLLSLVSSPLIDLKLRELAKIYSAQEGDRPVVFCVIYDAEWVEGKGILEALAKKESVGKSEAPV
jgi:hypothetical protein